MQGTRINGNFISGFFYGERAGNTFFLSTFKRNT